MLVVAPASVGMWALAGPISGTLYGTMKAAPVIAHLAPSIACLGIFQVTTGALQGIGKTAIPMWNMLFGAVVKAVAAWQLTSVAAFHILGAAWASNLNFALVAAINIFFLYRNGIPFFMDKGSIVVTLLAGMVVSVLVYGTAVMLLGCMTREEAAQLPVIGKIIRKFWK